MTKLNTRCEVVTEPSEGAQGIFYNLECGQSYVLYESLFRETRVTSSMFISVQPESQCTLTVKVERSGNPPITRSVTPTDTNRTISLTVDCLEKITLTCTGATEGACFGFLTVLLRWCKCC